MTSSILVQCSSVACHGQTIVYFRLADSGSLVAPIHLVCDLHVRWFQVKVSLVLECHFDHKGLGLRKLT